ncbi:Ataxin-3 [Terramyces sp. JEL0728]|nr:Ataxin-3 [Terramyces sp. JEL0728]KAJ3273664.1 Ataxin-3 [Terramyces sp. JEL0728]
MLDITIFHEKQEGQLCAQHAINNLLQGSYFTAVDLSSIAQQLDQEELQTLDPQANFQSNNYDDSGFFSVQVVARALQVFNLELLPFASSDPIAKQANTNPETQSAYICNLDQHWFAIRKFGNANTRFYNLNSVFPEPKHITETYLGMFLLQIKTEGYSIFIVNGDLPTSEADQFAMMNPIPAKVQQYDSENDLERAIQMSMGQDDDDLQRAIKESMMDAGNDEESLALAMSASLKDQNHIPATPASTIVSKQPTESLPELPMDEMRRKRLERFGQ